MYVTWENTCTTYDTLSHVVHTAVTSPYVVYHPYPLIKFITAYSTGKQSSTQPYLSRPELRRTMRLGLEIESTRTLKCGAVEPHDPVFVNRPQSGRVDGT